MERNSCTIYIRSVSKIEEVIENAAGNWKTSRPFQNETFFAFFFKNIKFNNVKINILNVKQLVEMNEMIKLEYHKLETGIFFPYICHRDIIAQF